MMDVTTFVSEQQTSIRGRVLESESERGPVHENPDATGFSSQSKAFLFTVKIDFWAIHELILPKDFDCDMPCLGFSLKLCTPMRSPNASSSNFITNVGHFGRKEVY